MTRASAKPRILLLTPPFVQLNTPYPATPVLTGFLRAQGYDCRQRDLSLEVALDLLVEYAGDEAEEIFEILRGNAPVEAKHAAAEVLDEMTRDIAREVDSEFGLSRYAAALGTAVPDFGVITRRLRRHTPVDRLLARHVARVLAEVKPTIVGVTCPFPGTLLGAFRIAEQVKEIAPQIVTVLGGGYVNTELRAMTDPRPARYFDHILFDEGYGPWCELVGAGHRAARPVFVKPCYGGLDLSRYLDVPETRNPMQNLWSTGRWLKLQLARGCYWRKCAFCDVSLPYIRDFAMPRAAEIVDAMQSLAAETHVPGIPGFHFTDEAVPPALLRAVSDEILRRRFKCRWWGNIRFDSAYTPALTRRMAKAGCIAVTGGLECAVDRLLALMNKGITCASARAALANFKKAGILTHAYLMYAFPTETEREARAALGFVRRCFREGILDSAFFHRFALTVHSPIARDPARFGIRVPPIPQAKRRFALNEIPFEEPNAPDWSRIGRALNLALYNYNEGRGLSKPISFWFA